jgi:hypothetical protein
MLDYPKKLLNYLPRQIDIGTQAQKLWNIRNLTSVEIPQDPNL